MKEKGRRSNVSQQANRLAVSFKIQQNLWDEGKQVQVAPADWLTVPILMIVNHNLPHSIVEWPEFHLLMKLSNSSLVEPTGPLKESRWSIKKLLKSTFEAKKVIVIKKLQTAISKIHFTTDVWSSPNKSQYQSVTVHYVDIKKRLQKATIALREHKESHRAEDQALMFNKVLADFRITSRNLGYTTSMHTSTLIILFLC